MPLEAKVKVGIRVKRLASKLLATTLVILALSLQAPTALLRDRSGANTQRLMLAAKGKNVAQLR